MTMHAPHLRELVIRPAMRRLGLWSEAAEELLMGTAAQESLLGRYLAQMGPSTGSGEAYGPALGIFQMEVATHDDCWNNYLVYRGDLAAHLLKVCVPKLSRVEQLVWNLQYAAAMCRVQYHRFKEPLPEAHDVPGLAGYWKRYWNTERGKGTTEEFVRNYTAMVEGR
jgi:hypothetical protein